MKIHKEGYKIIFTVLVILIILNVLLCQFFLVSQLSKTLIFIISLALWTFVISFFRVPKRDSNNSDNDIYSAADGKVVVIEEVFENEFFHDKRLQISVFMNVTNVHVNFAPIRGIVKYYKYHPGRYMFAWLPKSSIENERSSLVIENEVVGPILIRQIAGAIARRIVCNLRPEARISQCEEIGIIKFGSRVDLFLPLNSKVHVSLNQNVKAVKTIIASVQ
ncbi:MAG: phosphatidylserine decarboxylase family protein [Bacteroidales bacterium]|jgi:phosphatidylserine decarboxylase|nr:phosphatidylserine decarboxylase family protein [Bacteroidales bacterium]